MTKTILATLLISVASMIGIVKAHAGEFLISPVRLYLDDESDRSLIKITNTGGKERLVEIKVYQWHQMDGQDVLAPTSDLLVTPSIFSVSVGESQTIRVGVIDREAQRNELSYRIIISDVDGTSEENQSVSFKVNYSLPVFFKQRQAQSELRWRVDAKKLTLHVINQGQAHRLVNKITLSFDQSVSRAGWSEEGLFYILAGSSREWKLPASIDLLRDELELTVQSYPAIVTIEQLLLSSDR